MNRAGQVLYLARGVQTDSRQLATRLPANTSVLPSNHMCRAHDTPMFDVHRLRIGHPVRVEAVGRHRHYPKPYHSRLVLLSAGSLPLESCPAKIRFVFRPNLNPDRTSKCRLHRRSMLSECRRIARGCVCNQLRSRRRLHKYRAHGTAHYGTSCCATRYCQRYSERPATSRNYACGSPLTEGPGRSVLERRRLASALLPIR